MSTEYRPREVEPRWQRRWREAGVFTATDPAGREKRYVLEMLPYPSGRLHVGHVRNYTMGDVVSRYHRMRGRAVMHPMGWDSLGLPAENAARDHGVAPRKWTEDNIEAMRAQLQRLGFDYDWGREIASHRPEYYRWNQWFFLRFLAHDLAYRKARAVHWCPRCNTVLANEQVEDGACYRCESRVIARRLEQWFFRTTRFQQELLDGLDRLPGWPESLKASQRNWIGRSEGARVRFALAGAAGAGEHVEVFTTRIDTLFGCTFLVVAPDHPVLERVRLDEATARRLREFATAVAGEHVSERGEEREVEGLPLGLFATHPLTGERLPVWTANFVLAEYGTGAVMAVPAHDLRDLGLARRYGLPVRAVIRPEGENEPVTGFTGDGFLSGCGDFDGLASAAARAALVEHGRAAGFADAAVSFRLRDWGVSRQRYWGTPIPIVHCDACGMVKVPEDQLPVLLPDDVVITGEASPLARHPDFASTPCPRCGGTARRDPDTMDTFVDSSWYFLRYLDPKNAERPFDPAVAADWMPVDLYLGGPEHAVGHLIYFRWWCRALRAIGIEVPEEPALRVAHHGMLTLATARCPACGWRYLHQVRDGACTECGAAVEVGDAVKMSKSKRNVVEPDRYVERYGADTLRLFTMFSAPPGKELEWSDAAVEGMHRFLHRMFRMATRPGLAQVALEAPAASDSGRALDDLLHRTVHKVTADIEERLHLNTAIAAVMELLNAAHAHAPIERPLPDDAGPVRRAVDGILRLLAPFAPHACEEAWSRLGHATLLATEAWPVADPARLVDATATVAVQVNGRLRGEVSLPRDADEASAVAAARALDRVARHLDGQELVKVVHVPNRLLNLVVRPCREGAT